MVKVLRTSEGQVGLINQDSYIISSKVQEEGVC